MVDLASFFARSFKNLLMWWLYITSTALRCCHENIGFLKFGFLNCWAIWGKTIPKHSGLQNLEKAWLIAGQTVDLKRAFFVRTRKKLKGAQTQEKTQTQEKISIFRHFLGQKEKKQSDNLHDLPYKWSDFWRKFANLLETFISLS